MVSGLKYWWWLVAFEMHEFPVEVRVTVATVSENDAAIEASNILHDMGYRGGKYTYIVEQQDRVEIE